MDNAFGPTIPLLVKKSAEKWPELTAQLSRTPAGAIRETNYHDLFEYAEDFAGALLDLGLRRGDRVALISDNREEWEQADLGLLSIGCIDVPRGSDATEHDLAFILSAPRARAAIVEGAPLVRLLLRIKPRLSDLKLLISFDAPAAQELAACRGVGISLYSFRELRSRGRRWRAEHPLAIERELALARPDDTASIIFTSGTTGVPKGVMLSHRNILCQLDEVTERIYLNPGERALLVLPVWHAFQRAVEYVILSQGAALCYSRPVASVLLRDLKSLSPALLPAVPRVWQAVYDGIHRTLRKTGGIPFALFRFFTRAALLFSRVDRAIRRRNTLFPPVVPPFYLPLLAVPWLFLFPVKLLGNLLVFRKIKAMFGANFRGGIAGGGAFPENVDEFFWAIGVPIVEGYGLTETSPIISVRPLADPVFRNVGTPLRGIRVRVVDDSGRILSRGKLGTLQVKGNCVMQGYYNRPDLTAAVMTKDGWFDTGDLARLSVNGEIQLCGRKKDTIVLQGGENIEPLPIEDKINESRFISQSVVIGTNEKNIDQKHLAALVLPDREAIETYARENNIAYSSYEELSSSPKILKLLESEINGRITAKNGFKPCERISKIAVITKPFEVGVELSAKQEIMRYKIRELYKDKIKALYSAS